MISLITKDVHLLKEVFQVGEMSKFLAVGWDSSPRPGFPIKVQEGVTVHTWWGQQRNIKREGIFDKKIDTWGIILGDNPVGHCFVLGDLVSTSYFK